MLEDAVTHLTIEMAIKELLDSTVISGSRGFDCSLFFKREELGSKEHAQSQTCFIVGCGCVTSWDL